MAKEVNKRINIWINGKEVENNVKSIRAAMAQLTLFPSLPRASLQDEKSYCFAVLFFMRTFLRLQVVYVVVNLIYLKY